MANFRLTLRSSISAPKSVVSPPDGVANGVAFVPRPGLREFVEEFAAEFGRRDRRRACEMSLEQLLCKNQRKAHEMVAPPQGRAARAIHQFINRSPWNHEQVLAQLRKTALKRGYRKVAALVLDEFHVTKYGRHAVGFSRHLTNWGGVGRALPPPGFRTARSRRSQLALTWTWADSVQHIPIAAQLYLPPEWTGDGERLKRFKVPALAMIPRDRCDAAFNLLKQTKDGVPDFRAVVFDQNYGASFPFLSRLERHGIPYIAQMPGTLWNQPFVPTRFFPLPSRQLPQKRAWRSRRYEHLRWANQLEFSADKWVPLEYPDTDGRPTHLFAERMEMIPLIERCRPHCRNRWLIILRSEYDSFGWDYYVSNLPPGTSPHVFAELIAQFHTTREMQSWLHSRLGAGRFEGRSWLGFHHHFTLCSLAGEFLRRHPEYAP